MSVQPLPRFFDCSEYLEGAKVVGAEFLRLFDERSTPIKELRLLATKRSAGREIPFRGTTLTVRETTHDVFDGADVAFISATTAASHRPLVELAVRHAKTVICQKPFAENLADAEAMVAAAQAAPPAVEETPPKILTVIEREQSETEGAPDPTANASIPEARCPT